jgi:hypothetical protein
MGILWRSEMGVYHLMGLGRSPGATTGPLSYLATRYQRWNPDDQQFFSRSGEAGQRVVEQKTGDVQAIVLFTTREVMSAVNESGRPFLSFKYIENPPGRIASGPERPEEPMRNALERLLKKVWPGVSGGRSAGTVFWCEVDRRDIRSTFERVAKVVVALSRKEQWANLTGGNNVVNFALELAATLSGDVARLYYVQAENPIAEKCVYHTAENGYWVDLPVMPLALSRLSLAILDLLRSDSMVLSDLHSHLISHSAYSGLVWKVSPESLLDVYLSPMWKQGLIAGSSEKTGPYVIGPQWELVRPYQEILDTARQDHLTIEQLAEQESWLERQEISLR